MLQFCSDDKIVYFTFTVTSQSIYENKLDIISYVGINKAKKNFICPWYRVCGNRSRLSHHGCVKLKELLDVYKSVVFIVYHIIVIQIPVRDKLLNQ